MSTPNRLTEALKEHFVKTEDYLASLESANTLFRQGEYEQAREYFHCASKLAKNIHKKYSSKLKIENSLNMMNKSPDREIHLYHTLAALKKDRIEIFENLGHCWQKQEGQSKTPWLNKTALDEGVAFFFRRAVDIGSNEQNTYNFLIKHAVRNKNLKEAKNYTLEGYRKTRKNNDSEDSVLYIHIMKLLNRAIKRRDKNTLNYESCP